MLILLFLAISIQFDQKDYFYSQNYTVNFLKNVIKKHCKYDFELYNANNNDVGDDDYVQELLKENLQKMLFTQICAKTTIPFQSHEFLMDTADYILNKNTELDETKKTLIKTQCETKICILFVYTEAIDIFYEYLKSISFKFILISSSLDDFCVPYNIYPKDDYSKGNNILQNTFLIRWFAKNPCIIHDKLIPIPMGPQWIGNVESRKHIIKQKSIMFDGIKNEKRNNKIISMMHNVNTNSPYYSPHRNMRNELYEKTKNDSFIEVKGRMSFEQYLDTLKTYKYCLAPPGHGIDTHRIYECLLMGSMPIVISSTFDSLYSTLPIIILQSWEQELKENILEEKYKENEKKWKNLQNINALSFIFMLENEIK